MIVAFGILVASLAVIATVMMMVMRRRFADAKVTLPSRSGAPTATEQVRPAVRPSRRLPGIMPTAGHAIVPKRRSTIRPSVQVMSFDETDPLV